MRECLVQALVAQASEQTRQPFGPRLETSGGGSFWGGALAALGRLACVSRAYREEVLQPWNVDALLQGLAEPAWRAWARRCPDGASGTPNPSLKNPPSFTSSFAVVPPSLLGTLWRLLQTESRLPLLIARYYHGSTAAFDAMEHAPLLRPAAVFLLPRESSAGRTLRGPTKAGLVGIRPPRHPPCF